MTWRIDIWRAHLGQEVGHGVADDGAGGRDVAEPLGAHHEQDGEHAPRRVEAVRHVPHEVLEILGHVAERLAGGSLRMSTRPIRSMTYLQGERSFRSAD